MTLLAHVFSKLRTRKKGLRQVSKKCDFTVPFEKQHGKGAETPLKLSRRHLYHTYWKPTRILSLKKSLLVICNMLWLFVNTLTVDYKYSVLNRVNLKRQIHMQLSKKRKIFSQFFSALLKSKLNLQHFQKKIWSSWLMYFQNYGLAKRRLDNYLKSAFSKYPSTSNMAKALKHISNHHGGTFTIIFALQ